jgi:hypothetical protein
MLRNLRRGGGEAVRLRIPKRLYQSAAREDLSHLIRLRPPGSGCTGVSREGKNKLLDHLHLANKSTVICPRCAFAGEWRAIRTQRQIGIVYLRRAIMNLCSKHLSCWRYGGWLLCHMRRSGPAPAITGSRQLWNRPGLRFIIVGEMHNTTEPPAIFASLICLARETSGRLLSVSTFATSTP